MATEPTEEMPGEPVTGFISKEVLHGRTVKEGDSLDFMTVKSIDPETGEIEVQCDYSEKGGEPKPKMAMEALEEMPESE